MKPPAISASIGRTGLQLTPALTTKGLLLQRDLNINLTKMGRALAQQFRDARPPIWLLVQEFLISRLRICQAFTRVLQIAFMGRACARMVSSDMAQIEAFVYALAKTWGR